MGTASLILGILSFLMSPTLFVDLSLILGIISIVLGITAISKQKSKKVGIAGLVFSILAFMILVASEMPQTNSTLTSATNIETSTEPSQSNIKTVYNVGDVYQDRSLAIKFVSKNDNFKNYSKYANIKDGYKVIQASFEFENLSPNDKYIASYHFNCYADGYDCDAFYSVDDNALNSSSLSTGKKTKGNVYFEVPKNATEITLEYELNVWTSEKVIFKIN